MCSSCSSRGRGSWRSRRLRRLCWKLLWSCRRAPGWILWGWRKKGGGIGWLKKPSCTLKRYRVSTMCCFLSFYYTWLICLRPKFLMQRAAIFKLCLGVKGLHLLWKSLVDLIHPTAFVYCFFGSLCYFWCKFKTVGIGLRFLYATVVLWRQCFL